MNASQQAQPLPFLAQVKPYVPGEAPKAGGGRTFKLASNENPLGPSPAAMAAAQAALAQADIYPDGAARDLKAAISRRFGLDPARIVTGAGSDEIFLLLARAYLAPGDESVSTEHAFAIYAMVAQQQGAQVVIARERDLTADVDTILACVTPRTKVVWLANPNNPTGTYLPYPEIKRLHAGLPPDVLLLLDGAYAEFVRRNDYAAGVELASESDNVIVTRTFSKLYGLAGLRVGWGYAPRHVAEALERVRMPFNVSLPAQAAAIAALEDDAFVQTSLDHNDRELARLIAELRTMGLETPDSVGNFAVPRFADAATAAAALAFLKTRGVTVRGLVAYGMADRLRVSVGTGDGVDAVLAGLRAFLGGR